MRRLLFLAVVGSVVCAFALGAFAHHGASAQAAVRRAAAHTLDAGSSRFTITYASKATPQEFAAHGVMDYSRHRGSVSFGSALNSGFDVIYDGDVVYSDLSALRDWVPKGKHWLRGEGDHGDPFDPQERALRDPAALLRFLRLTSSEVREGGHEKIGEVDTTRYEGTLDLQRIVDQSPEAERADLQAELDFLREAMPSTTVSYSVWVDSNGVARRLRVDSGNASSTTIDFYDFGVPVAVDIPRASEILDEAEFEQIVEAHTGDSQGGCSRSSGGPDAGATVLCVFTSSATATATGEGP